VTGPGTARLLPEAPKDGRDRRSPGARDRARVLHSAALRRLAGKTQVVGPGEDAEVTGVPRTRLTHSLEVAQIGRDLALDLGLDPDTVDAAGLAHDIGHPPFGHNGEAALDAAATDCGGFEGNAQTLRLLTRLEPNSLDDERCRGLNLTRATLDACIKYPWPRAVGGGKFGVYADDAAVFSWVRDGVPPPRARARCVEAQVMDWADDVAYSVHDVEDAVLAGRMSLAGFARDAGRSELVGLAAESSSPRVDAAGTAGVTRLDDAELEAAGERIAGMPAVVAAAREPERSLAATVALKRLTSVLVGRFAAASVEATLGAEPAADTAAAAVLAPGHGSDLVVPSAVRAEVALLKAAALRYVMRDPARLARQARERALLTELVDRLIRAAPVALDPALVGTWEAAADDAERLRAVVDQVAVLTDAQAGSWCARLRAGAAAVVGPRTGAR